jgi:hypothetical protein
LCTARAQGRPNVLCYPAISCPLCIYPVCTGNYLCPNSIPCLAAACRRPVSRVQHCCQLLPEQGDASSRLRFSSTPAVPVIFWPSLVTLVSPPGSPVAITPRSYRCSHYSNSWSDGSVSAAVSSSCLAAAQRSNRALEGAL